MVDQEQRKLSVGDTVRTRTDWPVVTVWRNRLFRVLSINGDRCNLEPLDPPLEFQGDPDYDSVSASNKILILTLDNNDIEWWKRNA